MKRFSTFLAFSVLFLFSALQACTGGGGCSQIEPPPATIPPSQVVENGLQVRITEDGFETIKTILPQFVEGEFGHLAFIPEFWVGSSDRQYGIAFCSLGCGVDISRVDLDFDLVDVTQNSNNIDQCREGIFAESACDEIWVDLEANIYLGFDIDVFFMGNNITNQCQVAIGFYNQAFQGTIAMGLRTRPSDGQMRMDINSITDIDLGGLGISLENCIPILEDFLNALILENIGQYIEMVQAFVGNAIVEFIANEVVIPLLQPTIDKLFPDPMGLEGQMNVGAFMADAGFMGVDSMLELKMVSGGFVDIKNRGITAGIITGFNSDSDVLSRAESKNEFNVAEHTQGARCVPPIATFDFNQQGLSLVPGVSGASADRLKTFTRQIIQEFSGSFDQAYLKFGDNTPADVGIALTKDFLNLLGFHLVNSGALCLTVGTEQSPLLKVGAFSVMIPSLAELIDPTVGDAPLQLVIRPQTALEFTIGQGSGTETPLIDVFMRDFQIDVYPFVNGRYARALTLALDMHLQIDLEEGVDPLTNNVTVMPVLRPVDASQIAARVTNADLIRENPEDVAAIFPSILGMIMPMMSGALQPIPMPTYDITKMNQNGDYLVWRVVRLSHLEFKPTITADAALIIAKIVSVLPGQKSTVRPHTFEASLRSAHTYAPERLRATLQGRDDARPELVIDLSATDGAGSAEYQYSLDGGAYTPFARTNQLVIGDLPLFLQGKHTVKIRGRRAGSPESLNLEPVTLTAILDTLPPKAIPYVAGQRFFPGAVDFVSGREAIEVSFGKGHGDFTAWAAVESISLSAARAYAGDGELIVRLRDEAGNVSETAVDLNQILSVPVEKDGSTGFFMCATSAGTRGKGATWPLFLLLGAVLLGARLRRFHPRFFPQVLMVLATIATIGLIGCADGSGNKKNQTPTCFWDDDCAGVSCPDNEIPLCMGGQCECVNDIPWGIPGPYASFTVIGQLAWVGSYNTTYGDLMVTTIIPSENEPARIRPEDWFFVDGVPDGPVVLPSSEVRGGINARGTDVGAYTSVAKLSTGTPIIAHHNRTTGSVRISYTLDATGMMDMITWNHYDLDNAGDPESGDLGNAGLFNKLDVRATDGAPGVAYAVNNLPVNSNLASEVRFAQARVPVPTAASDWDILTVDTVEYPLPAIDAPLPDWPDGTGHFIALDRFVDGRAAIAWFDPYAGALKFSYQTEAGGAFAPAQIVAGGVEGELPLGLFCTMAVDPTDENLIHFVYQDSLQRSLWYSVLNLSTSEVAQTLLDDGFRPEDGTNNDGLPMPVQHYFGPDARIAIAASKIFLAWQDATSQEMYLGILDRSVSMTDWDIRVLRGNEEPYEGSVGFYIDMKIEGSKIYISTYGVNLHAVPDILGNPALRYYVEIFSIPTGIVGK
ncbi:MAG: hypothetical protein CVU59_00470 [Deltaproteobacteria bacterium HGW-Deltaproteobacteria-17]|nr:MAG: hypothetical protein CVU59_00470 [Deltaproteobacteria bacterium HGW-Deltaproteobacteria-17]